MQYDLNGVDLVFYFTAQKLKIEIVRKKNDLDEKIL